MPINPLNIVSISSEPSHYTPSRDFYKKELEAKFERLWLLDPEQFNPLRNCLERERLERSWEILNHYTDLKNKKIVDLGCGSGVFSRRMRDAGGIIDAVDIAKNALKHFSQFDTTHIQTHQEAVPDTRLPDGHYDIVVAMELIAELPPEDYRLFFAELSRLIKPNGCLLCSSAIDVYTEDGVERLLDLAQTEFDIGEVKKSYHALFIRLRHLFQLPSLYVEAWKNKELRNKELKQRTSFFDHWWFFMNTSFVFVWIWMILAPLTRPLLNWMKNSRGLLLRLEKICEFLSDEKGVSHVIFVAQRRPIHLETEEENLPLERPKKKEVWE